MQSKLKIATGEPSHYAFLCGHIAMTEAHAVRVTMWQECGIFHVREYDFAKGKRLCWDTYESLTAARKRYRAVRREILRLEPSNP